MVGGEPIAIDSGHYDEASEHLATRDQGLSWEPAHTRFTLDQVEPAEPHLCLSTDPETCIQNIAGRVEESSDGGTSWRTVWELDLSGNWLTRQLDTWEDAEIRAGSVLETPDGTVLVAVGSIPPIRRSVDGVWSPTEGDLRHFPLFGAIVSSVGLLILAVTLTSRPTPISLGTLGAVILWCGWFLLTLPLFNAMIMSAMVLASVMFAGTLALIVMALARPKPKKSARQWAAPGPIELAPLAVLNLGLFAWSQDWLNWYAMIGLNLLGVGASTILSIIAAKKDRSSRAMELPGSAREVPSPPPSAIAGQSTEPEAAGAGTGSPLGAAILASVGILWLTKVFLGVAVVAAFAISLRSSGRQLIWWKTRVTAALLLELAAALFAPKIVVLFLPLAILLILMVGANASSKPGPMNSGPGPERDLVNPQGTSST